MTARVQEATVREPLVTGAVGALGLALVDPPDAGIPWCPSALIFGIACPLCGLTRGVARAVRGDFAASVSFHPLAWMVLAIAAVVWLAWLGRRAGWWDARTVPRERRVVAVVGVALVVVWGWRLAVGTLPPI